MRSIGRITIGLMLYMLAVLAGGLSPADAGSCGLTATCTFELTVANISQLSPIDIRVTWNNTGSTTVLSVQWISGGPGTPGFINEFGYNSAVTTTAIGGNIGTSNWSYVGAGNEDSFGVFLSTDHGTAIGTNTPGVGGAITFTLASKILSIPDNANGTEFVAHVGGYPTGCSGWVGQAGSTHDSENNASCGSAVPDAGGLALVASGLVSVGGLLGTRFRRGRKEV